jgi:hypothetical protein
MKQLLTNCLRASAFIALCAHAAIAQQPSSPPPTAPAWTHIATFAYPGTSWDQSGLTGNDPSGPAEALLGSFGSGIDFDPNARTLAAICDRGPFDGASAFRCRVQIFELRDRPDDGAAGFTFANTKTVLLKSASGEQFVGSLDKFKPTLAGPTSSSEETGFAKIPARLDPEAIRIAPDGTWWISDEYGPWIDQFSNEGKHLRRIDLPLRYRVAQPGPTYEAEMPPQNTRGRQANRGLESLAISSDGKTIFTMTQSPLIQDGGLNAENRREGLFIRLLAISVGGATPTFREYLYELDDKRHGVNELLAASDHELLVLERDGAKGAKSRCRRVYRVDLREVDAIASATLDAIDSLPRAGVVSGVRPLKKTLELDLLDPAHALAGDDMPEKIEGLSFGPALADGRRTLLVSTDNDLIPENPTLVWVFAHDPANK